MPRTSDIRKTLEKFETASTGIDDLFKAACASLEILEHWNQARLNSDNAVAAETTKRIQAAGKDFNAALLTSKDMTDQGSSLTLQMVQLCDYVLGNRSHRRIESTLGDMQNNTEKICKTAETISSQFTSVGKTLAKLLETIESDLKELERRERTEVKKTGALERRHDRTRKIKKVAAAAITITGGLASLAFPPLFIILPVALPVLLFIAQGLQFKLKTAIKDHESRTEEFRTAIKWLKDAFKDMHKIESHVDTFQTYWHDFKDVLEDIASDVDKLRDSKSCTRALSRIRTSCESAASKYEDYSANIEKVVQLYQESCPIVAPAPSSSSTEKSRAERVPSSESLKRRDAMKRPERSSDRDGTRRTEKSSSRKTDSRRASR